jgi:hypothetical protein
MRKNHKKINEPIAREKYIIYFCCDSKMKKMSKILCANWWWLFKLQQKW